MGPQVSKDQMNSILGYIKIGKDEGAKLLTGGGRAHLGGDLENGNFLQPTVFSGNNKMRIFQEEIFGPVLPVTKFKDLDDAVAIGNDSIYGLGSGVWSRNVNNLFRVGREIKAARCWTNCYHMYPAGAAFGGYKESGFGRETHKIILDHYQQTKCLLISHSTKAMGLF
jgi:aldehyde dehydrogenase